MRQQLVLNLRQQVARAVDVSRRQVDDGQSHHQSVDDGVEVEAGGKGPEHVGRHGVGQTLHRQHDEGHENPAVGDGARRGRRVGGAAAHHAVAKPGHVVVDDDRRKALQQLDELGPAAGGD